MEYTEVYSELKNRGSNRKEPALKSTRKALEDLNRPDKDYEVILVGGTNGKGSTVEMVSEMLQSNGQKVGVYKSPHLVEVTERIKVDSKQITKNQFNDLYKEINNLDNELSFFEFLTTMAFLHFSNKEVDYAVMEVGMGGRLDATNATNNDTAVITNIDLEHTEYLGRTREDIGREIAGIIPQNGKLVTNCEINSINKIVEKRKAEKLRPEKLEKGKENLHYKNQKFNVPVKGNYQKENLETALATVENIDRIPENLENALSDLSCPGRMEVRKNKPLYIHDGAHNPAALKKIIEEIPEGFGCVFSAVGEKDVESMIEILETKASKFYFTESKVDRSLKASELTGFSSIEHECFEDPTRAEEKALNEQETVLATGSLYLIGNLREE